MREDKRQLRRVGMPTQSQKSSQLVVEPMDYFAANLIPRCMRSVGFHFPNVYRVVTRGDHVSIGTPARGAVTTVCIPHEIHKILHVVIPDCDSIDNGA